ncbi:hypothetical protein H6P81_006250 [Aristolochia fimbriata]|uniref:Uncharacterized protein n=1 Tax=Aristolochia fimbriata TaxID=158543 RepID=A0AAV7F0H6_ARIFI|nr:hypothetical protein H6P81_006250 [Aristolochia fimbriata]
MPATGTHAAMPAVGHRLQHRCCNPAIAAHRRKPSRNSAIAATKPRKEFVATQSSNRMLPRQQRSRATELSHDSASTMQLTRGNAAATMNTIKSTD